MATPGRPAEPIWVWGLLAGRRTTVLFDARDLIGLRVAEGEALADRHSCRVRVLVQDGVHLDRRDDCRPDRVNVAIADDCIVEVLDVG